jgi:hypothetical protein
MRGYASALVVGILIASVPADAESALEREVMDQLNAIRANPAMLAESLKQYRHFYRGRLVSEPGTRADVITTEGVAPVDEAIAFLQQVRPRAPFESSSRLAAAASDHTVAQGATGQVGHYDPNGTGPGDRMRSRGGGSYVAEVITYGSERAAEVVRQLIVDDGVPDRGHRNVLFSDEYRFAGVSCGPHPHYRMMCVVDLGRTPDGRTGSRYYAD